MDIQEYEDILKQEEVDFDILRLMTEEQLSKEYGQLANVAEEMVEDVEEEKILTTEEEREEEQEDVEENSLADMTVRGSEVPIFILETLS